MCPRRCPGGHCRMCFPFSVIGKIGFFILILMVVVFFVAIHSRQSEIVYVLLLIVFVSIALFSFVFWIAVNRNDGPWQHQQVARPRHSQGPVHNYKGHPRSKVHIISPPKMGAYLKIYTLSDDSQLAKSSIASENETGPEEGNLGQHSHHHHHHHHHHHRSRKQDNSNSYQISQTTAAYLHPNLERNDTSRASFDAVSYSSNGNPNYLAYGNPTYVSVPLRTGQSCINLPIGIDEDIAESEPIKIEVNLSRSASYQQRRRIREGFEEVFLPACLDNYLPAINPA